MLLISQHALCTSCYASICFSCGEGPVDFRCRHCPPLRSCSPLLIKSIANSARILSTKRRINLYGIILSPSLTSIFFSHILTLFHKFHPSSFAIAFLTTPACSFDPLYTLPVTGSSIFLCFLTIIIFLCLFDHP